MFLIRENNFGVEIIKYHPLGISEKVDNIAESFSRVAESLSASGKSLLSGLNVDQNGRDYVEQNNNRAYFKLLEYGTCNHWNFFITLTVDKSKFDRYADKQLIVRKITSWFNFLKHNEPEFRYILVPELHKDGAIHFHGLVYTERLDLLYKGRDPKTGCLRFRSDTLLNKFGANRFIKIEHDTEYVTYYMTKYIQKSLDKICLHRYYCSQGLKCYKVVKNENDVSLVLGSFLKYHNLYPTFTNKFIDKYQIHGITIDDILISGKTLTEQQYAEYKAQLMRRKMLWKIAEYERQDRQEGQSLEDLSLPDWLYVKDIPRTIHYVPEEEAPWEYVQDDFFDEIDFSVGQGKTAELPPN